ncbi:polysaccharide pyruvyl transferase family protein [Gloeothece verrucosa]|uniref:Polysaccharide pyruvyl transferase n=1 Tax=Gloeothece verrucosa (strain PCC 7822) TaxID=497965 RepID=E0UMZ5_GLOV7|nr:polysaccharide pyruvyl transferase family protein [Gloeothece verrucosa]ADN18325.1 polysaccharide pyruvyl transferase [Gloeothece verrucosa PCC 7822]
MNSTSKQGRLYYAELPPVPLGIRGIWKNTLFYLKHLNLIKKRKIVYALLPPPWIRNAGDQAQVIAIQNWLRKHFPSLLILELDQDQVTKILPSLRYLISKDDIIILHSGGNLGDRYMSTESVRRRLIQTFKENVIISLPQTIYFTNTEHGKSQTVKTSEIYKAHHKLTILCRDLYSAHLSESLLPQTPTFCIPDFVLTLPPRKRQNHKAKIVFCLRNDNDIESAFSLQEKEALIAKFSHNSILMDIRRSDPVLPHERQTFVEETLAKIEQAEVVVTDRFHGLIFAIVCQRPCVALPSIGHKMSFGILWFKELAFVKWAEKMEDVPTLIEECKKCTDYQVPNWNHRYFDQLPQALGLLEKKEWIITSELLYNYHSLNSAKEWKLYSQYQLPQDVEFTSEGISFSGKTLSADQWCYVYLDPLFYSWTNLSWHMQVQRVTDFREFAFNFRYQDFDNRYRYRFEAGRAFFDRRVRGKWENNMASVPFDMKVRTWYALRIDICGAVFRLYVNDELLLQSFSDELTQGSICIILWETNEKTDLVAIVKDIKVYHLLSQQ